MRMVWLVLAVLALAANAQEQPSFDNLLQQHEARLQGMFAQQNELQSLEQAQQSQQMSQLASILAPRSQPALFSTTNIPASELGTLTGALGGGDDSSAPTFITNGVVESSVTGLPFVPMNQAVMQFVQHQQQIQQQQESNQLQEGNQLMRDLETTESKPDLPPPPAPLFGPHKAVPKLQQWLTAMDPMAYSGPTFTNPVAKQVLKKLADPKLPFAERERLQRLVSSPYMFNMLGNPAFEDPQLWSGLVSGAAVPYPMRNAIMAQRTEIPFRIAATGDAMTDLDHVSVQEYSKLLEGSPETKHLGPFRPTHAAQHRIFKIIQHLHRNLNGHLSNTRPTSHINPLDHTLEVVEPPPNSIFSRHDEPEDDSPADNSVNTGVASEVADSEPNLGIKDLFGTLV